METKPVITTTADLHEVRRGSVVSDAGAYLTDVLLLCTECGEPIKARINTQQWIRVEWIGGRGRVLEMLPGKEGKEWRCE